MQAGDVLLLDTGTLFLQNHKSDRNFALVAEVDNSQPPRFERVVIACVSAIVAIVVTILDVVDLFTAAAMASAVMLITGCLSASAARRSVKWDVIVTIAAAFGLSNALEATGAGASASRNVLIISKSDPEKSPEFRNFSIYAGTTGGRPWFCVPYRHQILGRCKHWSRTYDRPQQITLPDPTNMFKRPNVLCCYGIFSVVKYV